MSRYTGYNQRGFANSTVAVTRAASGGSTPINYDNIFGDTVLYLPFDSDINDASSFNHTITSENGAVLSDTILKYGAGSLRVDDDPERITVTDDGNFNFGTLDFTIEGWFRFTEKYGPARLIHGGNNSSSIAPFLFYLFNDAVGFYSSSDGSNWDISNNKRIADIASTDTWYHLAVTREGNTFRTFQDGTLKTTFTSSSALMDVEDGAIAIGGRPTDLQSLSGYIDDLRIIKGHAKYTASFTAPTSAVGLHSGDPVSLYLPFDSDVNDDSSHGHTVTSSGGAAVSSAQAKFGGNSLALDGTNDYLTIASGSEFQDFDSKPFTIEGWFYCTNDSSSSHNVIMSTGTGSNSWNITVTPYQKRFQLFSGGTAYTTNNTGWTVNTWHHFAVCFDGSTLRQFIDGAKIRSDSYSNLTTTFDNIDIGRLGGSDSLYFNGYLDDIRITKGVARYTKNFVPPSQAVGATLNGTNETNTTTDFTSLYLPFDSDVNDDSDNPFTITASGDAAISSAQSKFGGNSLGLDGSGDYLTVGSSQSAMAFSGDFTIEFWMYFTSLPGSYVGPMGCHNSTGWLFQFNSGGGRFYINGSNTLNTTATTSADQWYHVAVSRSGSSVKLFIDGVEQQSITYSSALPTNNDLIIGASNASGQYFPGYLDDIRILNGYAKYTADFVVPTSAVGTSVSETVNDLTTLYLPFDGTLGSTSVPSSEVSLYLPYDSDLNDDSSNGHTASAGGGAAISSTQSKFGGYSLYLDGSDDRISYGDDNSFEFGSGDFTMEAFIYPTDLSHHSLTKVVLGKFSGQGANMGFVFGVSNTNYLQFFYSTTGNGVVGYFTSSTTQITTNQWYHIAVTRKGNTGYLFVDGNLELSFSFTSSIANVGTHLVVGAATSYGGGTPGGLFAGYIDDIRIIKGTALYISSFTAPTSPLGTSATAQTFLGGFEDQARNHGVTTYGDTTLNTSVKKFGTSSLYLDGSGDYALIDHHNDFNFGNDDFTIEGQFYATGSSNSRIMHFGTTVESYAPIMIYQEGSGFYLYAADTNSSWILSSRLLGNLSLNTWTHLAISRQGDTFRCFQDGVLKSTTTKSESLMDVSGDAITIGRYPGDSQYWSGYIDDLRIVKGHAKYTEAFTAPTSAHGHVSLEVDGTTSESYSDNKFLSGVWDITDVRDKMMQSTWISNDSRIPNGAGIQVDGHRWYEPPPELTFEVLVAAGGGGGGYRDAGGGGAGGLITWTEITSVAPGTAFPVTIGSGGGGGPNTGNRGTSGGDSIFGSPSVPTILTAIGGGGGASSGPSVTGGISGGSGGGGSRGNDGGSGTPGQGNSGGSGRPGPGNVLGGGGGGYSTSGNPGSGSGAGGTGYPTPAGLQANPTFGPTHAMISSGGGGGKEGSPHGAPGGAGGGTGGDPTPAPQRNASSYGSGGGGGGNSAAGGSGKDGVVVIRHTSPAGPTAATGGTISSHPDGYTYHVFTSPGTFTVS